MTQEFHISVTPLGAPDEYLVRIERVAPGVSLAEEQVKWPVENWLATTRQLMNDPLLGLLQENHNAPATQSSLNLVALGQQLYNALFQGSLRDSWIMAQAIAENHRSVLRLRLGLKGSHLPRLPWEVLHAGDRPLATGTDVAFSRYQLVETRNLRASGISTSTPASEPNQLIKILMVIAGPSDQETLKLKQEARHLQEELRHRSGSGSPVIQLTLLEQPGREQLTQALEQGQYQVFHYAGHSNSGVAGGDLYLVSGRTGLTETLNGEDLAGLLVNNGVQMAVFNSCRGAYTASDIIDSGGEQNLTQALVKRGIPSVLAMAERIPDEVALTLTRLFYRNLNQGYPIDLSLSRARQGLISAYGSNQLYWALPVLYLHPQFDGFLTGSHDPTQIAERLTLPHLYENFTAVEEEEGLFMRSPENPAEFPILNSEYEDDALGDINDELEPDGTSYEEDLALVSDLFRQLSQPNSTTDEPVVPVSPLENLLPESSKVPGVSEVYQKLPENPAVRQSVPDHAESRVLKNQHQTIKNSLISPKFNGWWQRTQRVPFLWSILGASGMIAIALLGVWFFHNRDPQPGQLLSDVDSSASVSQLPSPTLKQVNYKSANTGAVATVAIEKFSQGDMKAGQVAVEELLNRNALPQASAALAVVPKQQLDTPAISFLKGRLAWQSIPTGSKDFSLDDARRYWEIAVKKQPKSSLYLNALGFAYYTEGNFDRAVQVWFEALSLLGQKQAAKDGIGVKKDTLTTYAGLALALRQAAQKQPPDKKTRLLDESMKLYQKVMTDDPISFQPQTLGRNWMWSEKAIQDWQALLKVKK